MKDRNQHNTPLRCHHGEPRCEFYTLLSCLFHHPGLPVVWIWLSVCLNAVVLSYVCICLCGLCVCVSLTNAGKHGKHHMGGRNEDFAEIVNRVLQGIKSRTPADPSGVRYKRFYIHHCLLSNTHVSSSVAVGVHFVRLLLTCIHCFQQMIILTHKAHESL